MLVELLKDLQIKGVLTKKTTKLDVEEKQAKEWIASGKAKAVKDESKRTDND